MVRLDENKKDHSVPLPPSPPPQMKGEVEQAQESLSAFQSIEVNLHRTKKQYQQSVDHLAKAVAKQEKSADSVKVSQWCEWCVL